MSAIAPIYQDYFLQWTDLDVEVSTPVETSEDLQEIARVRHEAVMDLLNPDYIVSFVGGVAGTLNQSALRHYGDGKRIGAAGRR